MPVEKRPYGEIEFSEDQKQFAKGLGHLFREDKASVLEGLEDLMRPRRIRQYRLHPKLASPRTRKSSLVHSLEELIEAEACRDGTTRSITYQYKKPTQTTSTAYMSALQERSLCQPTTMPPNMKRYFRALSILEYEHDNGSMTDQEFHVSMVGESVWTPSEKKRFFIALERCGKYQLENIARRVGPTKTITEIHAYMNVLELASKGISTSKPIQHPFARQMSIPFIMQEEHLAKQLEQTLEVESYQKHRSLLGTLEKELDLFELWNLSSLTRIYGGTNDLTVLCSTTFNFYQLVKKLIQDIMIDLHTMLLSSKDKIVTKSLVNYVVAKKSKQKDPRLAQLDVMAAIDGKHLTRSKVSRNRSISFMAKRRRRLQHWEEVDEEEEMIDDGAVVISSDDSEEEEEDDKEEEDPMLEELDADDKLTGQYVMEDSEGEHEEAVQEYLKKNGAFDEEIKMKKSDLEENSNDKGHFVKRGPGRPRQHRESTKEESDSEASNDHRESRDDVQSTAEHFDSNDVFIKVEEESGTFIDISREGNHVHEKDTVDILQQQINPMEDGTSSTPNEEEQAKKEVGKYKGLFKENEGLKNDDTVLEDVEDEKDRQDEIEMRRIDVLDERQLSDYLGFLSTEEIMAAHSLYKDPVFKRRKF